jgi:hypothetical protein
VGATHAIKDRGEMPTKGPAKKVTIFINEDTQHHMTALHDSIMTLLIDKCSAKHLLINVKLSKMWS